MAPARLATRLWLNAMMRVAQRQGGSLTVLRSGDDDSGAVLFEIVERGEFKGLFEPQPDGRGGHRLVELNPASGGDAQGRAQYLERRAAIDPDLWVVELDVPEPERFIAELL